MAKSSFQFRLDLRSGVPVYRQLIDQVLMGTATGALEPGDQLPTVRQLAVDLSINPNTVVRAYKELELREVLTTQQGTGTFVGTRKPDANQAARQKRLHQMVADLVANAGAEGFSVGELRACLDEMFPEPAGS